MDDRAEAIDILTRMSTDHFYGHRQQEAFKLAVEALKQRWVPVKERLPEAYGRYLVALEDEDYISVVPLYYGRINRKDVFYDSDSEYGDIEYCGIIAWMPLPTPYKGGAKE